MDAKVLAVLLGELIVIAITVVTVLDYIKNDDSDKPKKRIKIGLALIGGAILAILVFFIMPLFFPEFTWGDGRINDYELEGLLDSAADMIRGQMNSDCLVSFSEDTLLRESPGYIIDSYTKNAIKGTYDVKGTYHFIKANGSLDEPHDFQYGVAIPEGQKDFAFADVLYFYDFTAQKKWINSNYAFATNK